MNYTLAIRLFFVASALTLTSPPAYAQPHTRLEVAASGGLARFPNYEPIVVRAEQLHGVRRPSGWLEPRVGLRTSVFMKEWLALEVEGTLFPKYIRQDAYQRSSAGSVEFRGGTKTALLAGVMLRRHVGVATVFATVRAGLVEFYSFPSIVAISEGAASALIVTNTEPVRRIPGFELGSGIELPLTTRMTLRAGIGALRVSFGPKRGSLDPSFSRIIPSSTVSLGFRF